MPIAATGNHMTFFNQRDVEYLEKYSVSGDFSDAITSLFSKKPTTKVVIVNGDWLVTKTLLLSNINDVTFVFNGTLYLQNNLFEFLRFTDCNNVVLQNFNLNGQNFALNYGVKFNGGENNKMYNTTMRNFKNMDENAMIFLIDMKSKNFIIDGVLFENLKQKMNPINIGGGKGGVQCIFQRVDETWNGGVIRNVYANELHNVDDTETVIFGDVDVIKNQYISVVYPDPSRVSSRLVIENVITRNAGKRAIKVQASGADILNVYVENSHADETFSAVGTQYSDTNVKGITIKGNVRTLLEIGAQAKNVNIQDVVLHGNVNGNIITIGRSGDITQLIENVRVTNVEINAQTTQNFIYGYSFVKNLILDNIRLNNTTCTNAFIFAETSASFVFGIEFINCNLVFTAPRIFSHSGDTCEFNVFDSTFVFTKTGTDVNPVFYPNYTKTKAIWRNVDFTLNNVKYLYGALKFKVDTLSFDNVQINDTSSESQYSLAIDGINVHLKDVIDKTNKQIVLKSDFFNIDNVRTQILHLQKYVNSVSKGVYKNAMLPRITNTTDVDVTSSSVYTMKQSVTFSNESTKDIIFLYPSTIATMKILNVYAEGSTDKIIFDAKSVGSFSQCTITATAPTALSKTVTVALVYTI